jgi:signal transduction histidine kinase
VRRAALTVAIAGLAIAAGVFTIHVARDDPTFSYAGASAGEAVALLAGGWALVAMGLAARLRRLQGGLWQLLAVAGFLWFLPEWSNPGIGSSLAFTIGLVFFGIAAAPFVGHAVLAYPGRRLRAPLEPAALIVAYAGSLLVLGLLPTLVFDPAAQGCNEQCPRNLLLVTDDIGLYDSLNRIGVHLGLAWALLLAAMIAVSLARATPAGRRLAAPVAVTGIVYLGFVSATFASSLDRGFLTNDELSRRLWVGEAAALVALVLAIIWGWQRSRRARSRVARLVVELAQSPPPGGLRDALARTLGDPELVLAYPIGGERYADAFGRPLEFGSNLEVTPVVSEGRKVALLGHRPGLLDPGLAAEVAAAARLVLENERLQADVRARLGELRRSRARMVEAGDAERRRLDRDLHDGAQQRLVALSLSLRLLRTQLHADGDAEVLRRLEQADDELRRAVTELRELAHGIFPAVLGDEGLAAAIESLAEEARVPIELGELPAGRYEPAVESAAYAVVAETARRAEHGIAVCGEQVNGTLCLEVEAESPIGDQTHLEDRVGAVDGRLAVLSGSTGRVTIRAEFPCAS